MIEYVPLSERQGRKQAQPDGAWGVVFNTDCGHKHKF